MRSSARSVATARANLRRPERLFRRLGREGAVLLLLAQERLDLGIGHDLVGAGRLVVVDRDRGARAPPAPVLPSRSRIGTGSRPRRARQPDGNRGGRHRRAARASGGSSPEAYRKKPMGDADDFKKKSRVAPSAGRGAFRCRTLGVACGRLPSKTVAVSAPLRAHELLRTTIEATGFPGAPAGGVDLAPPRCAPARVSSSAEPAGEPHLVLQYGHDLPIPIPDLEVDDYGVRATLSFSRTAHSHRRPLVGGLRRRVRRRPGRPVLRGRAQDVSVIAARADQRRAAADADRRTSYRRDGGARRRPCACLRSVPAHADAGGRLRWRRWSPTRGARRRKRPQLRLGRSSPSARRWSYYSRTTASPRNLASSSWWSRASS